MKKLLLILFFPLALLSQETKNYKHFSIGYDSIGTQWVSYRLTKEMVEAQRPMKRKSFLKFNGATTSDYTNTGYDRSHLLAANFMSFDESAYKDTFYLSNIVPMTPHINRRIWKYIEDYEESLATYYSCIYTVVKVIYGTKKIGKLTIPIKFIKIISKCNGEEIESFTIENI